MAGRGWLRAGLLAAGLAACAAGAPGAEEGRREPAVGFKIVGDKPLKPGPTKSPDGKYGVAVKGHNAQLVLAATGKAVGPVLEHHDSKRPAMRRVTWAFSPDGKLLATAFSADTRSGGDSAGDVRVWEVPGGKLVARPRKPLGYVHVLRFSADGKTLEVACDDISGK
jgi:WD40 repeat protein